MARRTTPFRLPEFPDFLQDTEFERWMNFWSQNTDWDFKSPVEPIQDPRFLHRPLVSWRMAPKMKWSAQAFLYAIFSHVLDSERQEVERKILSALIFIHLLNLEEPQDAQMPLSYFRNLNADAIERYKPYVEGYTEQEWGEVLNYADRSDRLFSNEEVARMNALFNFRNVLNGSLDSMGSPSWKILVPQYGGEMPSIPPTWVRIILESVWRSEQYALEGGLAVANGNEAGGWSVPYEQILTNVPLWLSPFDSPDISEIRGIKSYNFGVSPFTEV